MRLHAPSSEVWLPLAALVLLIAAFALLALIAEPGARLPPMPFVL